jgi:hypothetical protein
MLLWPKPLDLCLERGFDRPVRRLNGDHARMAWAMMVRGERLEESKLLPAAA